MANRIKEWRIRFGLSYARLGELAATTGPQIQKLERGERRLTIDWMLRIAAALSSIGQGEVHPKDLLPPDTEGPTEEQRNYGFDDRTLPAFGAMAETIPVHGAARGGKDQQMFLIDGAIDRVK